MPDLKHPALNPGDVPVKTGTRYPKEMKGASEAREKRALGDALGLTKFGVNLVRMAPGTESSIRHWHTKQDEFIYVVQGELTMITDEGEQTLTAGLAAGFKAGTATVIASLTVPMKMRFILKSAIADRAMKSLTPMSIWKNV